MVLRAPDGSFREVGSTTFVESCRAYRDRYLGDLECYEPLSWTPLP